MSLQVVPTAKPVGAEIRGVDLSAELPEETFGQIRSALDQHSVIFFRDQRMDYEAQVRFARRLGPLRERRVNTDPLVPGWPDLTVLSNIYEGGKPIGLLEAGQYWHSDNCFKPVPNAYAVLYAEEIPHRDGIALGGTMFASAAHAYETLDAEQRQLLQKLKARNNFLNPFRRQPMSSEAVNILWEESKDPSVVHPVIRTHPRTGRKCIYVNETYTVDIVDMPQDEGRVLIEALCRHITQPDAVYTHRWQVGDLLIWDDCAVQHHAIADYQLPMRRKLRRAAVTGTTPV